MFCNALRDKVVYFLFEFCLFLFCLEGFTAVFDHHIRAVINGQSEQQYRKLKLTHRGSSVASASESIPITPESMILGCWSRRPSNSAGGTWKPLTFDRYTSDKESAGREKYWTNLVLDELLDAIDDGIEPFCIANSYVACFEPPIGRDCVFGCFAIIQVASTNRMVNPIWSADELASENRLHDTWAPEPEFA